MVEVNEREPQWLVERLDADLFSDIRKLAAAKIFEELYVIGGGNGEVGQVVVVKVADSAGGAMAGDGEAGCFDRQRFHGAACGICRPVCREAICMETIGLHGDDVMHAAAFIEHAHCAAGAFMGDFREHDGRSRGKRSGCEGNRDHRARTCRERKHVLHGGVAALLAVGGAHQGADFSFSDLLEAFKVIARLIKLALPLVGARDTELCGGVEGAGVNGGIELANSLVVLLLAEQDGA